MFDTVQLSEIGVGFTNFLMFCALAWQGADVVLQETFLSFKPVSVCVTVKVLGSSVPLNDDV